MRVSIALKSDEHYDICLNAKKLELTDEFKAKLGWSIGNIYSRVGTADWLGIMSDQSRKEMLNRDLYSHCIIGDKEQLKQLKEKLQDQDDVIHNHDEAAEFIKGITIKSRYDKVMEVLEDVINSSGKSIPASEKEKLIKAIRSRSRLKTLIKN